MNVHVCIPWFDYACFYQHFVCLENVCVVYTHRICTQTCLLISVSMYLFYIFIHVYRF